MTQQQHELFQRHYTRARNCRRSEQPTRRHIDELRYRLRDDKLDIRKLKVDGKPHWCVVRWVHPELALGSMARGVTGLMDIPVIVKKIQREDGTPREVVENDIMSFVTITKEHARLAWEAEERKWAQDEKEVNAVESDFKSEVLLNEHPKFYQSIANENARRIESGEVQGYGTSGPAKVE